MSAQGFPTALRSWLFVPGDSEKKQVKALGSAADALILDLEDSVAPEAREAARTQVARLLSAGRALAGPQLWVRLSAPGGAPVHADLEAVCAGPLPHGIVLPKVSAAAEVIALCEQLAVRESGRPPGTASMHLLVLVTETPAGLLALPRYPQELGGSAIVRRRLAGLTWGAEDLSAALGATPRNADGDYTFTFQSARMECLLAAAALNVQAIDGVYTDFRDAAGFTREAQAARRDGFTGKLVIHPGQIDSVNATFSPSEADEAYARRVLAAFADAGGGGVASLDGQMLDRPHLIKAQRVLAARRS
jgi:citrate lyase subunit beta / citryl-CoA lyase